jgi:hypothetical protein
LIVVEPELDRSKHRHWEPEMELIEIVLTVCAISQPGPCEDRHLQFAGSGSLTQCVMSAQPYIAQWISQHPEWSAVRWHCEYPDERKRRI